MVQPGPRHKSSGSNIPTHISSDFYTTKVPGGEKKSLSQCLNLLAESITGNINHQEETVPSEALAFDVTGRELPRQQSITEDELWKKIKASNSTHTRGDLPDPELEEELPPCAPIPTGLPGDEETLKENDIDMNPALSNNQRAELWELIVEFLDVFTKGSQLGKVISYKASIVTDGKLPPPQHARPTGPVKKQVIDETINQLLAWDVVEKSVSTTASPIVIVWQNNKWQFCIDQLFITM